MNVVKRLNTELAELSNDTVPGVTGGPLDDDIYHWQATLQGPADSPYQNGLFLLDIHFGVNYPYTPPRIRFLTKIYHPNINLDGGICLDILAEKWSPALSISGVLLSISSLLTDPNPDSPLNHQSATLYKTDRKAFEKIAREWTNKHAC